LEIFTTHGNPSPSKKEILSFVLIKNFAGARETLKLFWTSNFTIFLMVLFEDVMSGFDHSPGKSIVNLSYVITEPYTLNLITFKQESSDRWFRFGGLLFDFYMTVVQF
jgi:hypothetical protein